ncbi:hypothetical protein BO71DRAFT_398922 [Aspergillus ellipticus CBS 707.79]|uniref:Uncharacterized protein n=1 Tax=Aspergillus ellipticus CBS 707.79 TaxID=1448320 RepID=A0A319DJW3_9EURO|nr:hypothetical protein BO71DRAFT_398922 [Aspergillus ellipticus CBS 707.79]
MTSICLNPRNSRRTNNKRCLIFDRCQALYSTLRTHESPFITPDELRNLGVRVSRAEMTPEGTTIDFQPSYFEPLETSVFEQYPASSRSGTHPADWSITYEKIPEERQRDFWPEGDLRMLDQHISSHLMCYRQGLTGGGGGVDEFGQLEDLTPLKTRGSPIIAEFDRGRRRNMRILNMSEDRYAVAFFWKMMIRLRRGRSGVFCGGYARDILMRNLLGMLCFLR